MFQRLMSVVLTASLLQIAYTPPVSANTMSDKEIRLAEKVRAGIAKLGTGTEAKVEVKLRDKRKLKGYVSEAGDEHFTVIDAETGAATQIAYPQVKTAKGNNLSSKAKIAIGAAVVAAIILIPIIFLKSIDANKT